MVKHMDKVMGFGKQQCSMFYLQWKRNLMLTTTTTRHPYFYEKKFSLDLLKVELAD
jgi:hypothetical protein